MRLCCTSYVACLDFHTTRHTQPGSPAATHSQGPRSKAASRDRGPGLIGRRRMDPVASFSACIANGKWAVGKRCNTDPCIAHHHHRISLHPVASSVISPSLQQVCASRVLGPSRVQALQHPPAKGPEISFSRPLFRLSTRAINTAQRCHLRTCSRHRSDGAIQGLPSILSIEVIVKDSMLTFWVNGTVGNPSRSISHIENA